MTSLVRMSAETDKLDAAVAKSQIELTNPIKDKNNPHLKSKYTDAAAGLAIARPILGKHGIALYQVPRIDGTTIVLTTRLAHAGQWIEADYPVCAANGNHQQMGAAMTYAKRQGLFALIGIAGDDEDDDGKDAAKAEAPPDRKTEQQKREDEQRALASETAANGLIADLEDKALSISKETWDSDNAEFVRGLLPVDQARVRAAYKKRFPLRAKTEANGQATMNMEPPT